MKDHLTYKYRKLNKPITQELSAEEEYEVLSETEKNLYVLREQMLTGKIPLSANGNETCYQDAISFTLHLAVQDNLITQDESDRLYEKYI